MKREPLVSILMNCYNGEAYLREAIESVLSQTYQNWEIIFWDNQSTDRSAEIFQSYRDPRFKYFYASRHTDLGGGRAKAWEFLTGEFIAILDTDDVWFPEKLEKQIRLFDDPEVGLVISDTLFFNDSSETPLYKGNYPKTGWVFEDLLKGYFVSLETLVFRRSAAMKLPRAFDPEFSFIADFDLVVRLSRISKLALYPEVLAKWRMHNASDSWKFPQAFLEEKERWLSKQVAEDPDFEKKYSKPIQEFKNKNMRLKVVHHLIKNRNGDAMKCLLESTFDHWHYLMLLFFCFMPFPSRVVSSLYKYKTAP